MAEDIIYHYTSIESAFSIITSKTIRLTDHRYLKDRNELEHGYQLFLNRLGPDLNKSFKRAMIWHNMQSHHCVLSFSKSPQILSQWRAYASDGEGVALGFSKSMMAYLKYDFLECEYENIEDYVTSLVEKHRDFAVKVKDASEECIAENVFMMWIRDNAEAFYDVVKDLIKIKHPAYKEEQEVRVCKSVPFGQVKHRVTGSLLVPFIESDIWPRDEQSTELSVIIQKLWLGPKCNKLNHLSFNSLGLKLLNDQFDCGYI